MQADHPPSLSATLFEGAGLVAAGVALDCPEPTLVYVQNDTLYLQTADIAAVSAWAALIGGQIRTVPMDAEPGDGEHYLGHCVVPSVPFRVAISGRDRMGQAFRRVESPLRTPR
jgi:hypothetical protein